MEGAGTAVVAVVAIGAGAVAVAIAAGVATIRVGATGRGRRIFPHSGPKVVSSTRLHHSWVGEGEEMERMGG